MLSHNKLDIIFFFVPIAVEYDVPNVEGKSYPPNKPATKNAYKKGIACADDIKEVSYQ